MESKLPYDQRIARWLVRPLVGTVISPNHVTAVSLLLTLSAAWLFATGEAVSVNWAAGLFVLGRFLDHFDGELARLSGKASRFGYYFDYIVGGLSYGALFAGIGVGLAAGPLAGWALALAFAGAASAVISLFLNLGRDHRMQLGEGQTVGYPRWGGFELEDGIYLLAPITWLGWLTPFFVAAGIGAALYCLWTLWMLLRA